MKLSRLILTAILYGTAVNATLVSVQALAAGKSLEEKKKERPVEVMSESVGKKVVAAIDLVNQEKSKEAIAILLEIEPKKDFDKAYLSQLIGKLYAQDGNYKKAIEKIKAAADMDVLSWDEQAGLYKILAVLSLQEEKYNDAIKYYDLWFTFTEENDATVYTHKALSYYQLKQYKQSVEMADLAIQYAKEPKPDPYQLKMSAYVDQKDYKSAIDVTVAAVEKFPSDKKWWIPLGQFYLMVEDYGRALSTFELSDKQGFLDKAAHYSTLAQLYSMYGVPYKAASVMEAKIKSGLIEKDVKNLSATANYYHQASDYKRAAKFYKDAATLGNDAELYRKVGELLGVAEDYKGSIEAFEKAIALGSVKSDSIKASLIEAHFYAGNYKEAYKYAKESLESKQNKRMAEGWIGYIKDTANRKNISVM